MRESVSRRLPDEEPARGEKRPAGDFDDCDVRENVSQRLADDDAPAAASVQRQAAIQLEPSWTSRGSICAPDSRGSRIRAIILQPLVPTLQKTLMMMIKVIFKTDEKYQLI